MTTTIVNRGTALEISAQLNEGAATAFAQWIGCYTVVWNLKTAEYKDLWVAYLKEKETNPDAILPKPDQKTAHFNTEARPWLKEVPSQIRRNAASQCMEAVTALIRGVREGLHFKSSVEKRSCLVTKELFEVVLEGGETVFQFKASAKSAPFCTIRVPQHISQETVPNMVWISRLGTKFWISFAFEKTVDLKTREELLAEFALLPPEVQDQRVLGMDAGVKIPAALSNGAKLGYTEAEKKKLEKLEIRRKKYQKGCDRKRRMAKKLGAPSPSKNYQRNAQKLRDCNSNIRYIRRNMAHRVSKTIVETDVDIIVVEDLQLKNMVKRPAPKQDPVTKKYLKNGARAKAGLNRVLHHAVPGMILQFILYKAAERNKLVFKVPAAYSSQECVKCSHRSSENRPTQSEFQCVACGHTDNADNQASGVVKKRWLVSFRNGTFAFSAKTSKRISRKKMAARTAVSVCGAGLGPDSSGTGVEAETSMALAHEKLAH